MASPRRRLIEEIADRQRREPAARIPAELVKLAVRIAAHLGQPRGERKCLRQLRCARGRRPWFRD